MSEFSFSYMLELPPKSGRGLFSCDGSFDVEMGGSNERLQTLDRCVDLALGCEDFDFNVQS